MLQTICAIAGLLVATTAFAQAGAIHPNVPAAPQNLPGAPREANGSDQTLEIAPRVAPTPPAATQSSSAPGDQSAAPDDTAPVPTSGVPAAELNPQASQDVDQKRPYLGISVQYVISHAMPGREVHGLEVVGVDSNSPAEHSGLRGRGAMTTFGASGATAGALMPPLDLLLMPLLKKSRQLGESGDLIVAIDDKRIESERDLETELDTLKPGDTIYLTIVRPRRDASRETLKMPVKLGDAIRPMLNAAAVDAGARNRSQSNPSGDIAPTPSGH
jgi:hypothetical protein